MDKKYALQIDGLRLIAMVSIFCNHCDFLKLNPATDYLFEHFFHFGGIGVEFFILLSGFMAAISYNPNTGAKTYFKKRAIRLFPVHLICMLLFIPLILYTPSIEKIVALFLTTGLLQSISPNTWNYYNPASWTISTLWLLYLMTPYIMRRIANIRKGRIITILILSIVAGFYLNSLFFDQAEWFFYISPFYRIVTFLQGILLAQIIKLSTMDFHTRLTATVFEMLVLGVFVAELVVVTKVSHCGYFYTLPIMLIIMVFYVGGGIFHESYRQKLLSSFQVSVFHSI